MKNLIEFTRRDECPCCNTPRAIECYDIYNKPINYAHLLDQYEMDKDVLNRINKTLAYMKCRRCNEVFMIYWDENREIPMPMNTHLSGIYFDTFIKVYK